MDCWRCVSNEIRVSNMDSDSGDIARSRFEPTRTWFANIAVTLFLAFAVAVAVILIRGDSWSKMKARAAAKGQIDYYSERRGQNNATTLTARRSMVSLLVRQKFPRKARTEFNRFVADLQRLPDNGQFEVAGERFQLACELGTSGYPEMALEEFSLVEAQEGISYTGILSSRWIVTTLLGMERYAEAEEKCLQILSSPERMEYIQKSNDLDPWTLLARSLAAQGKHSEAEVAFIHAIASSTRSHGTDHFMTHLQRVQLAHSLVVMGRREEALEIARKALPVYEDYEYSYSKSIRELMEFVASLER